MKARNKLQRRYSDVKKQEGNCEPQTSSLKCKRQCTPDFFRDSKKSSKVWLIQFKILKHGEKRGLFFCRETKRKTYGRRFLRLKASTKGTPHVFTGWSVLRKVSLINLLKCQKNSTYNVFKAKEATRKVLILLLDCNVHISRYNRRF